MVLSVLARGSLDDKLRWAFSLYDTNGDGVISKQEMTDVVTAIYDMMGKWSQPMIEEHTASDHVERVFQVRRNRRRRRRGRRRRRRRRRKKKKHLTLCDLRICVCACLSICVCVCARVPISAWVCPCLCIT